MVTLWPAPEGVYLNLSNYSQTRLKHRPQKSICYNREDSGSIPIIWDQK